MMTIWNIWWQYLSRSTLRPPLAIYSIIFAAFHQRISRFISILLCMWQTRLSHALHTEASLMFSDFYGASSSLLCRHLIKRLALLFTISSFYYFFLFVVFGTLCFVKTKILMVSSSNYSTNKKSAKNTFPLLFEISGSPCFTMFKCILVQFQHLHDGCFDLVSKKRCGLKYSSLTIFFKKGDKKLNLPFLWNFSTDYYKHATN